MGDLVISPDNMDDDTFALHMTHRHGESMGGLGELKFRKGDGLAIMWRSFHRRLHEVRVELDVPHEHATFHPPIDGTARDGASSPIRSKDSA